MWRLRNADYRNVKDDIFNLVKHETGVSHSRSLDL